MNAVPRPMAARRILRRQETFRTVMRQNSMEFDEANQETRQHSTDGLNFAEFCGLVHQREDGKFTEKELRERFRALDVSGSGFIEKHEYLRFSLRDALARSVTRVMDIFSAWDENHDGQVSALEFRRAVRSLGFSDVSDTDIDQIFHEFDDDESGAVSQLELERKLKKYAGVLTEQKYKLRRNAGGRKGAALSPSVKLDRESGRPVNELLRDALSDNAVRVIDLFRDWDENQDGLISKQEFAKAMAPLGIQVSKEEAGALFDAFDPDGSGAIEYKELDQLLRRRVDIGAEKRARRLARSQRSTGLSMARVLPQPTIPLLAKVPSVALLHQLEGTLGGCALTHCTDFDPTTFTAAGTFMGAAADSGFHGSLNPSASMSASLSASLSASRGGRNSRSMLGAPAVQKGDRFHFHYSHVEVPRPVCQLLVSKSLPSLVSSEVVRYTRATAVEQYLRTRTTALLVSPDLPTNVFSWPAVQGVPDLDHLAQLWMAPRIGPAWRYQPNQTRVCLPPMSTRIELQAQKQPAGVGARQAAAATREPVAEDGE